jgi:hypothetical protein
MQLLYSKEKDEGSFLLRLSSTKRKLCSDSMADQLRIQKFLSEGKKKDPKSMKIINSIRDIIQVLFIPLLLDVNLHLFRNRVRNFACNT